MIGLGVSGGPTERRSYTSTIIEALTSAASGRSTVSALTTGAVAACAFTWGRALASATVDGPESARRALAPSVLFGMGHDLARHGEAVYRIGPGGRLDPAGGVTVEGGPDPDTWSYRLDLVGPTMTEQRTIPADGVIHVRHAPDPIQPWRGRSPIAVASATGRLAAGLESALGDEASNAPRATVSPVPEGPQNVAELVDTVQGARGRLCMPETTAAGYGDRAGAPMRDFRPARYGPDPPAPLIALRGAVEASVCACYGIHPSLLGGAGDGTAMRESWRRAAVATFAPLARLVAEEIGLKWDAPVTLEFDALKAADRAGNARAYRSLRDAGMSDGDARRLSGLEGGDA